MGFRAFDHSVSIIAYKKEEKNYGMTCAWAMQVDYDKLVCLLGAQSDTAKNIKSGDLIGVSVLCKAQKDIAKHFGENHSLKTDKFFDVIYFQEHQALLIPESARMMVCEVMDVMHLKEIEEDSLVYVKIVKSIEGSNDFLHYGDM
ncbi:MAG: flavin reductase family protein [Anaeroplasmataceae bacterium]|nr:flavin reductase family protein [Anaeroplasmataceae bacterium]